MVAVKLNDTMGTTSLIYNKRQRVTTYAESAKKVGLYGIILV